VRCLSCHAPHGSSSPALVSAHTHPGFGDRDCKRCHTPGPAPARATLIAPERQLCVRCHSTAKPRDAESKVHDPVAKGDCASCHSSHASPRKGLLAASESQLCARCHSAVAEEAHLPHGHDPVAKGDCRACHDPHQSNQRALLKGRTGDLCLSCHKDLAQKLATGTPHAPAGRGLCLTCHAPHGAANAGMLKREGGAMCAVCHDVQKPEMVAKHPGQALATVNCVSCHDPHVAAKGKANLIRPVPHLPFARGECTSCHTAKGERTLVAKGADLCAKCHKDSRAFTAKASKHPPMHEGAQCLSCHEPHAGNAAGLLKKGGDALCVSCHPAAVGEGRVKHKALEKGCVSCHDAHGGAGPSLITAKDESEMCRKCHTDLRNHYHPTQSTRPDPRTGQAMRCSSCHQPHSSDLPGLLTHDPKRELCVQCHDPSMAPKH
jgi:predicted CXXCH cytochrome family protein